MSSAFPTSSANALTGLEYLGCCADSNSNPPTALKSCQSHSTAPKRQLDVQPNTARSARFEPAVKRPVAPTPSKSVAKAGQPPQVFHRVAEVRESQGLTERTIAKRMGIDIRSYRRLECATTDLCLSELVALQKALDVPLVDLLEDQDCLSRPVEQRAGMVKVMKTAVALREIKAAPRVQRLSSMLCEQLVSLMPELRDVSGWPQFGARRGQSAVAKALMLPIDTSDLSAD
ncbi:helix-turn-helix domain-containing protein [Aureliella helgolandensis]|uniref:HTH cro/C1-type domain-containing protein n=1 Tax=Aureliella helgolandensis TaxID=2527968 RepID=A0A518G8D2_9BACT|nr:helix-turn-helix transcriptional regulator [Aureliella helgolandensis]QDV24841.1 hypothetical protein Q31a_31630 [Aureliella helgolandensis]